MKDSLQKLPLFFTPNMLKNKVQLTVETRSLTFVKLLGTSL